MIVQGDSYKLAPALWSNGVKGKPDLVFVDPFKIGDSTGQPAKTLSSLKGAEVPFMCWTPLSCVPNKWPPERWSLEDNGNRIGNQSAQRFVRDCVVQSFHLAWFSWQPAAGLTREMYGCQLTLGNVSNQQFNAVSIWQLPNGHGLPYLDLSPAANTGQQSPKLQKPSTTWQTPGQALIANAPAIQAQAKPGVPWWDKYHAAFWWP